MRQPIDALEEPPPASATSSHVQSLANFRPLVLNPNRHTERGLQSLERSIQQDGYVAPMTAAADGTVLDGNARLETVAHALPLDPIVIHHDGTRPIVAVRTDIPNADDPRARRIAVTANRIGQIDLDWDMSALREFVTADALLRNYWTKQEQTTLLGLSMSKDPTSEMPSLEQWSIIVGLPDEEAHRTLLQELDERGYKCRSLIL